MDITEKFKSFTLLGAEWVLWLLIALSIVSVAIMIERLRYFRARRIDLDLLIKDLRGYLSTGDLDAATKKYGGNDAIEVQVGLAGVKESPRGAEAAAEAMIGAKSRQRLALERNLAFLGTLGNNAPFIGLFGTCLGIIKAFNDLAENSQAGAKAVMSGVSEALVSTAIGLLVALPAVMTYNYFQRRVRASITNTDALAHELLAQLRGEPAGKAKSGGREAA